MFLAIFVSLPTHSYASETDVDSIFTAEFERWRRAGPGNRGFNYYHTLGIKLQATQAALNKCLESGSQLCAFKSSSIVYFNNKKKKDDSQSSARFFFTKAETTIQSVDELPLREGEVYSDTAYSESLFGPKDLNSYTTMELALSAALQSCQQAGNHFCVILDIAHEIKHDLDRLNYRVTGLASVKGYSYNSSEN